MGSAADDCLLFHRNQGAVGSNQRNPGGFLAAALNLGVVLYSLTPMVRAADRL
jgi:hypothetical protein